jgi:hypothetical protein
MWQRPWNLGSKSNLLMAWVGTIDVESRTAFEDKGPLSLFLFHTTTIAQISRKAQQNWEPKEHVRHRADVLVHSRFQVETRIEPTRGGARDRYQEETAVTLYCRF